MRIIRYRCDAHQIDVVLTISNEGLPNESIRRDVHSVLRFGMPDRLGYCALLMSDKPVEGPGQGIGQLCNVLKVSDSGSG